ncbi:competence type IV pilus minor pilin ComGE [Streptococcus caviae]|uniref:competence type IV pilus minor pilin ComGE n=1 Tax=Streptococcus sp. 'caviae' TaxID=1915004 RepID=UPI00094BA51B|nr:competence type IV pilus minor pilin ComGE [Streptococcus sp. 'caviae']OLN83121.1 Type II secretory pathway, pseudopilin PulG [Streptococcus sp. 'caviae']
MVNIKKQKMKAYILLESLIALGLLVTITSLILQQINHDQKRAADNLQRQEVMNAAIMAVQTKQDKLSLNGVSVRVVRDETSIAVYHDQGEVISLVKE